MKTLLPIMLLIMLLPATTASTYILGSHQVSFNVSEPYNSSAKFDTPSYNLSQSNDWTYTLNMTVDQQHILKIMINELSISDYGRTWPSIFAELRAYQMKTEGVGGYKSSTMDFKGYPAYQESYPAQKNYLPDGNFIMRSKHFGLDYEIDEKTVVHVLAFGDVPYQEILDTINVTEAPKKPTKYAPYVQ
jgi:hypothetical protein